MWSMKKISLLVYELQVLNMILQCLGADRSMHAMGVPIPFPQGTLSMIISMVSYSTCNWLYQTYIIQLAYYIVGYICTCKLGYQLYYKASVCVQSGLHRNVDWSLNFYPVAHNFYPCMHAWCIQIHKSMTEGIPFFGPRMVVRGW